MSSIVLVPQGAEYRAVCRGVKTIALPPPVLAIPVGIAPLLQWLAQWQQQSNFRLTPPANVIVMGLCGSLSPKLAVGEAVQYMQCCDLSGQSWPCQLITLPELTSVIGLTSDRLVVTAQAKQHLVRIHQADVVDMEGTAVLSVLAPLGIAVTMLRVVSDDAQHDVPDISAAITAQGNLQPWLLAQGLLRQPIAASRLIRGALQGLDQLQKIAAHLPVTLG